MSAPGRLCPPVLHPSWWTETSPAALPAQAGRGPAVSHQGRLVTIRCRTGTTVTDLRALDPARWSGADVAVLELRGLPGDPALVRAVAALRVRLLVRGMGVELQDPPDEVRAAAGGSLGARYRVVDGPFLALG